MADGKNYTVKPGDTLSTICAENPDLGYSSWQELRNANLGEILRVGREQMAAIGVAEDVTRKPCGLTGHNNQKHEIIGGIHYDEPSVPTIYPGTTLFLKAKPEPPKQPDTPQPEETEEEKFTANEIHKDRWIGVEHQAPAPKLEIFIPPGNPDTPDITYSADPTAGAYAKLLSYTFSESVDDLEGSCSFTVENEEIDKEGKTVFDLIPIRSVVKIYEGGKYAAFVGIIRRRRLGVSMTSQGVKRTITFSGKSIISCIAEYAVSLDVRIQNVANAAAKSGDLQYELSRKDLSIKDFMSITWEHFKEVSQNAGIATTGIAEIIDKFIGKEFNKIVVVGGKEQKIYYGIAAVFYNASNNVIADVWRGILPKPVYEIFSYCDTEGKPKVMARQEPYGDPDNGNYDWGKLPIYLISPISLTAYDLDQSDEEVYTAFASYIIGSVKDRAFYMAVNQEGPDDRVQHDIEKQKIYGFKPLEITFSGYNRQGNAKNKDGDTVIQAITKLNKLAAYWYSRLDDMYSGSITICTDFNHPETNPRVGCRAKFMGGEFYINKTDHTWNYGGTPTIKLTVSRGLMYDQNGKILDGENGVIKNVGRRFRELEREKA